MGGDFPPLCQSPLHSSFWSSSCLQCSCSFPAFSWQEPAAWKRAPATPAASGEGPAGSRVLLCWWVKHSPLEELLYEKGLSCDGQVILEEQGISQVMNCQCHHREFSQVHSPVRGREGAAIDLSGLFLMRRSLFLLWSPGATAEASRKQTQISANQCSSD